MANGIKPSRSWICVMCKRYAYLKKKKKMVKYWKYWDFFLIHNSKLKLIWSCKWKRTSARPAQHLYCAQSSTKWYTPLWDDFCQTPGAVCWGVYQSVFRVCNTKKKMQIIFFGKISGRLGAPQVKQQLICSCINQTILSLQ